VHTPARGAKARGGGSGPRIKHIQLNRDLMAAAKSGAGEQLCALVAKRRQDFNTVNAATAYQQLLRMRTKRDTRRLPDAGHAPHSARDEMLAILELVLCEQHIPVFGARECANTLHTLAKTRRRQPCEDVLCALEAWALVVRDDFNPQDISNMLWAFATLGLQPSKALLAGLTEQAMVVQGDFKAQGIANTLWSFATLGLQPSEELMAGMMKQAVVVQGDFKPQNIANTLWAFATLGLQPNKELMVWTMKQAVAVQGDFKPQEIANTLWAFATLGELSLGVNSPGG